MLILTNSRFYLLSLTACLSPSPETRLPQGRDFYLFIIVSLLREQCLAHNRYLATHWMNGCIDRWMNQPTPHLQTGRQRLGVVRKPPRLELEPRTISVRRPLSITMSLWIKGDDGDTMNRNWIVLVRPALFYNAAHKLTTIVFLGEGRTMLTSRQLSSWVGPGREKGISKTMLDAEWESKWEIWLTEDERN